RSGHGGDPLGPQVNLMLRAGARPGAEHVELHEVEELRERGHEPAALVGVDRLSQRGATSGRGDRLHRAVAGGPTQLTQDGADGLLVVRAHDGMLLSSHRRTLSAGQRRRRRHRRPRRAAGRALRRVPRLAERPMAHSGYSGVPSNAHTPRASTEGTPVTEKRDATAATLPEGSSLLRWGRADVLKQRERTKRKKIIRAI